eukprot:6468101-Lingulodinium_polyedra.AAC.1
MSGRRAVVVRINSHTYAPTAAGSHVLRLRRVLALSRLRLALSRLWLALNRLRLALSPQWLAGDQI